MDEARIKFEINPKLDPTKFNEVLLQHGRVRIRDFLKPASADALYRQLADGLAWRTFLVAEERLFTTPPQEPNSPTAEDAKEVLDCAYGGAQKGFACLYDADRLFPEDVPEGVTESNDHHAPALAALDDFLNSAPFLDFVREVLALPRIERATLQATRFRRGHFLTFHSATWSADKTLKRRASFFLNLTPQWNPDWGGLLEFRNGENCTIEGYVPCFDALDLALFPQGYWISAVAPFVPVDRLVIAGRLYVA
jgi:SM-20-related protein